MQHWHSHRVNIDGQKHTFEKDKSAIVSLIRCINVSWKASPKVADGHGVIIQYAVSSNPPEPASLKEQKRYTFRQGMSIKVPWC